MIESGRSREEEVRLAAMFEAARLRYKPEIIKYLFVAEAPPDQDRFFYFERVPKHDNLFLETMKVLYPRDFRGAKDTRLRKEEFLRSFRAHGFYLVDAVATPLKDRRSGARIAAITYSLPKLQKTIDELVERETWVLLISTPVYMVCAESLRVAGVRVANQGPIKFPGSGWQREYRLELEGVLQRCGWSPGMLSQQPGS